MARLGDICDILNGFAFRSEQYTDSGIRIIRIANVQKGYIEDSAPVFYPTESKEAQKYMLSSGDLLMSLTGNVGRVALIGENFLPAALNQRVACLRIKNETVLNKNFLFNFLNSDYFEGMCIASSKGVAQKNMSTEWLKEYEIPLFPVEKQLEIASILDKLATLVSFRKQQLAKLDELVKAKFVEMFGDLKRNSMDWSVYTFNDFASIDTTMIHDFTEYGEYPHIGIDSIEKDTGNLSGYRTVKEDGVISGKYLFTPEHIIYSKIRPNLNKVALPDFAGVCSADAYPILPKKEKCNRVFLAYTLRNPVFLDYILAFSNRTNLPKVNKQQVEGFCCPIPDIELQEKFSSFFGEVARQKLTIQQSLDKLEVLRKSLMQEYFG